jgi:signal transduction histidine kinase
MKDQFGLQVQLEANSTLQDESAPLKVFMFRAAQELLFNVVKHAGVKSAHVVLSNSNGWLEITVSDKGRGFDPQALDSASVAAAGIGLLSLRERASHIGGKFEMESAPGLGSRFSLMVPICMPRPTG